VTRDNVSSRPPLSLWAAVQVGPQLRKPLIARPEEVPVQAMENRQLSAVIVAIKEIGVRTGLRIERS
jgi:hypothetical protein